MIFDLPELPEGWAYETLESCSKNGSITYGIVQPGAQVSQGVPIIRVNNFRDMHLDLSDVMHVQPEIAAKYERTKLHGGEVLLTIVGTVGQVAVVSKQLAGFNVARAVAVIHPLPKVSADWIALCLRSPLSRHLLVSRANTTVQTTINLKDLRALPIPVPPEAEREEITALIGALDDRIALLRETNATLEAFAQALFKSWFVDFDPVYAKQQGIAPAGMDDATAALFPDGFEESALGEVPRGWNIQKLESFIGLAYGKALKSTDRINGDVPVYGSGGITGFHNTALVKGPSVIVGRKGTVGSLYWEDRPFFPIDTVFYLRPMKPLTYCYYLLQTLGLESMNTDAAVPGLNRNNVYRLLMPVAADPVLDAFDQIVAPLRAAIFRNSEQAQTLATLRDTLLPRLISGQLRLPEAEEQLAEAIA